jgi:prepilin-type N-terminal cleavage/methylation domain-containing protein
MKNNKGFTLIEMLVVIAIILALSVSAGLSADFSLKKAQKNEYKDIMWEVFKAADVYSELSSHESCLTSSGCNARIDGLVAEGLLDENIYKKNIPIYTENKKFVAATVLVVKKVDGVKTIQLKCSGTCTDTSCTITMDNLSEYHKGNRWGNCK